MNPVVTGTGVALGGTALLGLVVYYLNTFVNRVAVRDWPASLNQLKSYVVAALGVYAASASTQLGGLGFNGVRLDDLNWIDKLILAVVVASFAGAFYDFRASIDNTDTAAVPNPFRALSRAVRNAPAAPPEPGVAPSSVAAPTPSKAVPRRGSSR